MNLLKQLNYYSQIWDKLLTILFNFDLINIMSKCSYCGSSSYGGCSKSPSKYHCIIIPGKCAWCGSSSYGGCSKSPSKYHAIINPGKCTYCGSTSRGGCSKSPSKSHTFGTL